MKCDFICKFFVEKPNVQNRNGNRREQTEPLPDSQL